MMVIDPRVIPWRTRPAARAGPAAICMINVAAPAHKKSAPKMAMRRCGIASRGTTNAPAMLTAMGIEAQYPAVAASIPLVRRISGRQWPEPVVVEENADAHQQDNPNGADAEKGAEDAERGSARFGGEAGVGGPACAAGADRQPDQPRGERDAGVGLQDDTPVPARQRHGEGVGGRQRHRRFQAPGR